MATNAFWTARPSTRCSTPPARKVLTRTGPTAPLRARSGGQQRRLFVRRVFIGGEWQDYGARFDPPTRQVRLVQAGAGLAFEAEAMRLDFASLPVAP